MGLTRMVDHIKPLLRPKRDQQFSHSLCQKETLLSLHSINFKAAVRSQQSGY